MNRPRAVAAAAADRGAAGSKAVPAKRTTCSEREAAHFMENAAVSVSALVIEIRFEARDVELTRLTERKEMSVQTSDS